MRGSARLGFLCELVGGATASHTGKKGQMRLVDKAAIKAVIEDDLKITSRQLKINAEGSDATHGQERRTAPQRNARVSQSTFTLQSRFS